MSETVITVENLSKRYVLGKEFKPAKNILSRTGQLVRAPFSWLTQQIKGPEPDQVLWALKDVSFVVKRGEAIGIIGRNGAGKSTLLKILSRITEPTEGYAEIMGRVGTLLEVGTGMHPELTGRENIYMNATILGMTKKEVDARFDEIVDFSGVEKFIDTPVKRYSSGMRVRLGFAIAAHLEPEILIVDEVLAVGDAEFQRKCLGKMQDAAFQGRTVLFVSHNMGAIQRLCDKAILLEQGVITKQGDSEGIIQFYIRQSRLNKSLLSMGDIPISSHNRYPVPFEIYNISFTDLEEKKVEILNIYQEYYFNLKIKIHEFNKNYLVGIIIKDRNDNIIVQYVDECLSFSNIDRNVKNCTLRAKIRNMLSPGSYIMRILVKRNQERIDDIDGIPYNVSDVMLGNNKRIQKGVFQYQAEFNVLNFLSHGF